MALARSTLSRGFVLAGLMNLTVLIFSRLFTNDAIPEADPVVMSNFGLLMIAVWGLAYIAVARNFAAVKWLVAVFALEKLAYGIAWLRWLPDNDLSALFAKDAMAGAFYSIYGINDWLFCGFFAYVFYLLQAKSLGEAMAQPR